MSEGARPSGRLDPGRIVAGALVAVLVCFQVNCGSPRDLEPELPRPKPRSGMVVSESPLASEVGARILREGGNAVDAAVATALALAVVYPQAGNLGGGGFALYVPHEGEPLFLDFRERAPATATADRFTDAEGKLSTELALSSPWSVAVPGSPAGLFELHKRLGSNNFTFAALCKPAVQLARKGFAVDASLVRLLADDDLQARLQRSPGARDQFYPSGKSLAVGERFVQEELAVTLEMFGKQGPEFFYRGLTSRQISAELRQQAELHTGKSVADVSARGLVSALDLDDYLPVWRSPLRGWFRGMEVITVPPPSSGGIALLQILAVLDGFPIEAERRATAPGSAPKSVALPERTLHWWIEGLRCAFAERALHLGDPDHVAVPIDRLLSPEWIARARVSIGEAASADIQAQAPAREGQETTHLSVLDGDGNAVSLTTTLNSSFGSGIFVRGAGFLLNNEMDDFALEAGASNQFGLVGSDANSLAPGKRPLSSMTPTVLRRGGGSVALVIGSPGGPRIITSVAAVIVRTLLFDETLSEAVAAPRFHQQWRPTLTEFEPGWPVELLDALRRRGHVIGTPDLRWGRVQAVSVSDDGIVEGVSDSRGTGSAISVQR